VKKHLYVDLSFQERKVMMVGWMILGLGFWSCGCDDCNWIWEISIMYCEEVDEDVEDEFTSSRSVEVCTGPGLDATQPESQAWA
jgi:hypothetical protein